MAILDLPLQACEYLVVPSSYQAGDVGNFLVQVDTNDTPTRLLAA